MASSPSLSVDPWLGPRFEEALGYAQRVHGGQTRKGTSIPYMAHLLGVVSLVLEDGGNEDEAIAALLHDAVEDQGGTERLEDIRRRFGDRVAAIVMSCSQTLEEPAPSWKERKQRYLDHLRELTDEGKLRVSLADKLHNSRAMVANHRRLGDELFARFNAPKEDQCWYYEQLVEIFTASPLRSGMIRSLAEAVAELFPSTDTMRSTTS